MQEHTPLHITPIPALKDNYIWTLIDNTQQTAVIVDPGESTVVLDFLQQQHLTLIGILITHHHWDHTNGIAGLLDVFDVPVYGPATEAIAQRSRGLKDGAIATFPGFPIFFQAMDIPGHTAGHIAYYAPGMLFCGDTLFAAGCGRLFEGTAAQMLSSLEKFMRLPDETRMYCAHEYTANNLRFAKTVEPNNAAINERIKHVAALRAQHLPSLPSTLGEEKQTNPFLRCNSPEIKESVERHFGESFQDTLAVFTALRKWKDGFA